MNAAGEILPRAERRVVVVYYDPTFIADALQLPGQVREVDFAIAQIAIEQHERAILTPRRFYLSVRKTQLLPQELVFAAMKSMQFSRSGYLSNTSLMLHPAMYR